MIPTSQYGCPRPLMALRPLRGIPISVTPLSCLSTPHCLPPFDKKRPLSQYSRLIVLILHIQQDRKHHTFSCCGVSSVVALSLFRWYFGDCRRRRSSGFLADEAFQQTSGWFGSVRVGIRPVKPFLGGGGGAATEDSGEIPARCLFG